MIRQTYLTGEIQKNKLLVTNNISGFLIATISLFRLLLGTNKTPF
jgi:hypothetical protein